jgi:hypothetical protein
MRWCKKRRNILLETDEVRSYNNLKPPTDYQHRVTDQVGFAAIFKHFAKRGFEFILLPSIVHAHPSASTQTVGLSGQKFCPKGSDIEQKDCHPCFVRIGYGFTACHFAFRNHFR